MNRTMTLYEWETRGGDNCPLCERLKGIRQTLEFWKASLMPGFHKGCDCCLVQVTTTVGVNCTRLPVSSTQNKTPAGVKQHPPRVRLLEQRVPSVRMK